MPARDRLIVALDCATAEIGLRTTEKLRRRVGMFKIGSELFTAEGPSLARKLVSMGEGVFLDLKFHDIPNTVRGACREAARLGVRMMNVHACGGRKMMEAAVEGAREGGRGARPLVLAVTVLTSLETPELAELGIEGTAEEVVVRWARMAQAAGLDGVVASAREVAALRSACGPRFLIVTPGIRPASPAADDQQRTATPGAAIEAGADYLVVGRPITTAPDPASAADAIVQEIERALGAFDAN